MQHLTVFNAEIRRRLWWQITSLDARSAQLTGAAADSYADVKYDTKPPLNLNDSDLNPAMTEVPQERHGVTEMLFCMIQKEINQVMRVARQWKSFSDSSVASVAVMIAEKDKQIDDLRDHLRDKYLDQCDLSIPFHRVASILARSALCHMRLMAHHPRQYPDKGASMPQNEKNMLFHIALKLVEHDNLMHAAKAMSGYLWHVSSFFILDAFIYLLSELRQRSEGEEAQDAWVQVIDAYNYHPEIVEQSGNSLYWAIGNLALKAWERRPGGSEWDLSSRKLTTPTCIATLRSQRRARETMAFEGVLNGTGTYASQEAETHEAEAISQTRQQIHGTQLSTELDHTLLPASTPIETNPMDWEHWQILLDGWDPTRFDLING